MAFRVERDDERVEARQSVAATFEVFPRVDGVGNVIASAIAGENHRVIHDENGAELSAQSNLTPVTVTDPDGNYSRFDVDVPAISLLQENAFAVITWRRTGETFDRVETAHFDVVLQPWAPAMCSINDMVSKVNDLGERLSGQAERLSTPTTTVTAEEIASEHARQAHWELYTWLRAKISAEAAGQGASPSSRMTRPRLLTDRRLLKGVEVLIAIAMTFESDMHTADVDTSDAASLYQHWIGKAHAKFRGLGDLRYDSSEDRTVDTVKPDFGRVSRLRRVQS